MNTHRRLHLIATRCLHEGPPRRRADAETILDILPELDEDSARTYLLRFLDKWGLNEHEEDRENTTIIPLVRRRPMTELERRIHEEMAAGDVTTQTTVTFAAREGSDEERLHEPPAAE